MARERGLLDKIEVSNKDGLVTFPRIGDDGLIPDEVSGVDPGHPGAIDHTLWGEFLDDLEVEGSIPRY